MVNFLKNSHDWKRNTEDDSCSGISCKEVREDAKFIEDCVRTHNTFRSKVNPPASNMFRMSWDAALAKSAKAWAKKCKFNHNTHLDMPGMTCQEKCIPPSHLLEKTSGLVQPASSLWMQLSGPGLMKSAAMISAQIHVLTSVVTTLRLSGQRATKLAVQFTSAIQLKIFQDCSKQRILFVTMGQRKLIVPFGVFCFFGFFLNIPMDLVSDANSCNKFQNKLHPHVTYPRETFPSQWEQNLLDIAGTAKNLILKKAGLQIRAQTTHHNEMMEENLF
uniref:SCP domain-containing protein n=1 Tax=Cyanistes caeruleus TaxID=156563 RepID=A0A8C0UKK4_CYACU